MHGTATQVEITMSSPDFRGDVRLYRLEPKVRYKPGWSDSEHPTEYVVVSAVLTYSGPETYIFPADADGGVLDWLELGGSIRGVLDHREALRRAGYTIKEEA